MKKLIVAIFLSFTLHLISFSLMGQAQANHGYMYGKITTFDDDVYEGQIRWGKEEAYWTDMFNASKIGNDNIDYLSDDDLEKLSDQKDDGNGSSWGKWSEWISGRKGGHYNMEDNLVHQFSCQFGEIKQIDLSRWKKVEVILKDDSRIRVSGDGYNDIGTEVIVYDNEKGKVELDWSELLLVEFMDTPNNFEPATGSALYGTVETHHGDFTGLIQWDKDERVATDILDGSTKQRKRKIEFGDIRSIEKFGKGCDVLLKNERDVFLYGSNDVNSENRGIIVSNKDFGRVVIEWSDFDRVTFHDEVKTEVPSYADFKAPEPISGTVTTKNGKSIRGKIVYDLDEQYGFEILNGDQGKMEFQIPFRNVHKITPKRRDESIVQLKSNQELILEDSQDITSKNEGLLIFESADSPIYVSWRDIEEIVFND